MSERSNLSRETAQWAIVIALTLAGGWIWRMSSVQQAVAQEASNDARLATETIVGSCCHPYNCPTGCVPQYSTIFPPTGDTWYYSYTSTQVNSVSVCDGSTHPADAGKSCGSSNSGVAVCLKTYYLNFITGYSCTTPAFSIGSAYIVVTPCQSGSQYCGGLTA
jgi:hypothetical protein